MKKQISIKGRIDTTTAEDMDVRIGRELEGCAADTEVVLDCSDLQYISSTGLRVVLKYKKLFPQLSLDNVTADVYNVFEITGFSRILTIRKALREVCIDGSPVLGKGGVGTVYRLTDETILKVFREGTPQAEVQQEIDLSREAFVYGLPTAISFEMVRVGRQYGIIHELLNAQTLANIIQAEPDRVEHYGSLLGRLMKQMHATRDDDNRLPDAARETRLKLAKLRRYFSQEQVDVLCEMYDAVPQGNSILHCDLHPKNVMMSNGELFLIDMGEVCHGNPIEDLSHTYSSMMGLVGDYQEILGMDESLAHRCFLSAMQTYFDGADDALFARRMEQIRVVSLIRNISWLSLSDSFPDHLVASCRQVYADRIEAHLPYIRQVLAQLPEWHG